MLAGTPSTVPSLLKVEGLTVAYQQGGRWLEALSDVSLVVGAGEIYGLVGESGSGKTTLALAIMRFLSPDGAVLRGRIELAGRDLLALEEAELQKIWGRQIALVPQNPQSALNPSIRVGEQLAEVLRYQLGFGQAAARRRARELFEMVHLADPDRVASSYPHEISGGMQQRVLIAMALSTEPELLILDEPTTNLDVTTQAVILDLVNELIRSRSTAVLYVTHNLGVVRQMCNRVAVLYAGEIVEDAAVEELFRQPLHPYTQGLLDSQPRLGERKERVSLRAIQGQIPSLDARPEGCVFRARCPLVAEICEERPPFYPAGEGHHSRCHFWEEIERGELSTHQPVPELHPSGSRAGFLTLPLLDLDQVEVHFPVRRSLEDLLHGSPPRRVLAVDKISLEIPEGATLGLVGESGSGKTTLARAITGLIRATGGSILLSGQPLPAELAQRNIQILRRLQMVFQNPVDALNPYLTLGESLSRPLITLLGKSRKEAGRAVPGLLAAVRLPENYAWRLPGQLSGGELQRAAIARAFASAPDLLLCDEPVSSLDVSVQASILNLLNELQAESGSTLLFVSHNLAVVGYLSDIIAVIYLGNLMEVSPAGGLFERPYHPYTEALLFADPLVDTPGDQKRIRLEGEIPSPVDVPSGCPFHTRCPRFLGDICVTETPPWREVAETGKRYFCHIPEEDLRAVQEPVLKVGSPYRGEP
jgi:peptide/nickel transport system ATP-binding protein